MGSLLVNELLSGTWDKVELAGGSLREGQEASGDFFTTADPASLFEASELIIDFTNPDAAENHIALALEHKIPLLIGTTGLHAPQEHAIREAAKEIPLLQAANTSLGITLLQHLVKEAASRLGPEWDIEVFESHHRHKVDAPSGTALMLGEAAREGRGCGDFVFDHHGGERKEGTIGFAVARGGDVAGEHDVTFYAQGERLTLGHKATDRALFAKGAIFAAKWLSRQEPGLYTMKDVLEF